MGHQNILQLLLSKGCHPNLRDNLGYTPLMLACKYNQEKIALFYLMNGILALPDLLSLTNHGDNLLHCVAYTGSIILTRKILLLVPMLHNELNDNDETPCDICEEYDQTLLLDYLIQLNGIFGEDYLKINNNEEERIRKRLLNKQNDIKKRQKDEINAKNGISLNYLMVSGTE
jgi:ankyrin repeat protein